MDRPPCSESHCRRWRGDMRHERWNSRYGWQSHRLYGLGRLPRVELEIESRVANCERAWLSGATRQLHGDAALFALPGRGPCTHDSSGRSTPAEVALRRDRARGLRPWQLLRTGRIRTQLWLA